MKKIVYALGLMVLLGGGIAVYQYNKPHRDIRQAKVDFEISAQDLFREFSADETAANEKYLDQIMLVSGEVQRVHQQEGQPLKIILRGDGMFGVRCELDPLTKHQRKDFQEGERLAFKGICTGMLMDVVMVRCVEAVEE